MKQQRTKCNSNQHQKRKAVEIYDTVIDYDKRTVIYKTRLVSTKEANRLRISDAERMKLFLERTGYRLGQQVHIDLKDIL